MNMECKHENFQLLFYSLLMPNELKRGVLRDVPSYNNFAETYTFSVGHTREIIFQQLSFGNFSVSHRTYPNSPVAIKTQPRMLHD